MDKKNLLRVGIIGCGKIGSLWDESLSSKELKSSFPKTHACAYAQNDSVQLVALCDSDIKRAEAAASKWNAEYFTSQLSEFLSQRLDIISVCVPTESRMEVLSALAEKKPDVTLLLEKPLANNLDEATKIKNILQKFKKPVTINYSRRFAPGIQKLKKQISEGHWGHLQAGTAYYGNGYANNGSHMLDLICYLIGAPKSSTFQKTLSDDRLAYDSTISSILSFENSAQIEVHGLDHRQFTVFELDLMFSGGRVRLVERGTVIQSQRIIDDPVYSGFRILGETHAESSGYEQALKNAISEVVQLHTGRLLKPSCGIDDAYNVMKIIEDTRRSSK